MPRLVLRLDDPSPTSDHALERALVEVHRRFNAPLACAVVPVSPPEKLDRPLLASDLPHLAEESPDGVIEIIQHGYQHNAETRGNDSVDSEFRGVSQIKQRELIVNGKKILENVFRTPISGFTPPFNTYDAATLRELGATSFRFLSAGMAKNDIAAANDICIIPKTVDLKHLPQAIAEAERLVRFDPILVAVMHHYDFDDTDASKSTTLESSITMREYEQILGRIARDQRWEICRLVDVNVLLRNRNCLTTNYFRRRNRMPMRMRGHVANYSFTLEDDWASMLRIILYSLYGRATHERN